MCVCFIYPFLSQPTPSLLLPRPLSFTLSTSCVLLLHGRVRSHAVAFHAPLSPDKLRVAVAPSRARVLFSPPAFFICCVSPSAPRGPCSLDLVVAYSVSPLFSVRTHAVVETFLPGVRTRGCGCFSARQNTCQAYGFCGESNLAAFYLKENAV